MEKLFSCSVCWPEGENWNIAPVNCDNWRNWKREREKGVEKGTISDMNNTPEFQKRQHYLPRKSCWCSNMRVGIRPCSRSSCVDVIPCCAKTIQCANSETCQTSANEESVTPVSWNWYKNCHYTNTEVYRSDLLRMEKVSSTKCHFDMLFYIYRGA